MSRVAFDAQNLTGWESSLLTFLLTVIDSCQQVGVQVDRQGLPKGVNRLIDLARP